MSFKFELGKPVVVGVSKKKGLITGRAEFVDGSIQYLIQYIADGLTYPSKNWIYESALSIDIDGIEVGKNTPPIPPTV